MGGAQHRREGYEGVTAARTHRGAAAILWLLAYAVDRAYSFGDESFVLSPGWVAALPLAGSSPAARRVHDFEELHFLRRPNVPCNLGFRHVIL